MQPDRRMQAKAKEITETPILSAKGISKSFGATRALSNVSFDLMAGEIHGLIGENGAGKSTLIKILAGDYFPDQGEILFQGKQDHLHSPAESLGLGIRVIYQEFNLVNSLTVAENICLGNYPASKIPGMIQWQFDQPEGKGSPGADRRNDSRWKACQRPFYRRAADRGDRQSAQRTADSADHGRADGGAQRQ